MITEAKACHGAEKTKGSCKPSGIVLDVRYGPEDLRQPETVLEAIDAGLEGRRSRGGAHQPGQGSGIGLGFQLAVDRLAGFQHG